MSAKKIVTGKVTVIESATQFEEYKSGCGDMLLVVDFYADWCGPCKAITPTINNFAETMPDVCFIKVNVDDQEEVAAACDVTCMPTFHFYKNGSLVKTFSGANKDALSKAIVEFK